MNFLFKLSYLNFNFALTLGYLTKHLNNLGLEKVGRPRSLTEERHKSGV